MYKKIFIIFIPIILFFTTGATIRNTKSSYVVIEKSSKRVLEGENINEQMLIASTAKILTAITVIENYDLEEEITITINDVNEVGSKVYLRENEKIKRKDLLYALMLRSANDAASALSGNNSDKFIFQMNETAKKIGMTNSVFENASGLDEREYNLSTAYDMALLSMYASKNETFIEVASSHTYTCQTSERKYTWSNKHKLVKSEDTFIWGKTGYTKKSGRILVSNYNVDNKDIIIVTINYGDDWNYHKKCAEKINQYNFVSILKKGLYEVQLEKKCYITCYEDVVIPIIDDEYDDIKIIFKIYNNFAIMEVWLINQVIVEYRFDVYDEANIDFNKIIDVLY